MSRTQIRLAGALFVLSCLGFAALGQSSTPDGEQVYGQYCSSCHQAQGQGVPAAFPPLAGHLPTVAAVEGGRGYLVRAVLFGVRGQITADGATYNGLMPGWAGQLSDEQIAAVLNHELTAWGNDEQLPEGFEPITAAEVAEARGEALSTDEVYELRQSLGLESAATTDAEADGSAQATTASLEQGAFTAEQADRGSDSYNQYCTECHGSELQGSEAGPGLIGASFKFGWDDRSVAELYSYIKANMPYDRPNSLRSSTYADIVAHILRANEFPAGEQELEPDPEALQNLTIDLGD